MTDSSVELNQAVDVPNRGFCCEGNIDKLEGFFGMQRNQEWGSEQLKVRDV